jgi:hypothetical protein
MTTRREQFVQSLYDQYGEIVSRRLFKHSLRQCPDEEHFAVEYSKVVDGKAIPVACLVVDLAARMGVA